MDRTLKLVIAVALCVIAVKMPWQQANAQFGNDVNVSNMSRQVIENLAACIAAKSKQDDPFKTTARCWP